MWTSISKDRFKLNLPLANIDCVGHNDLCKNEFHDNSNHGIFCVTEKDLDLIDIDELF